MDKKFIVILNGTGGCGKDTFKDYVGEFAAVTQRSSIDKVKEVAAMAGWTGGKTEKDRRFLSDLKILTSDYNDLAFMDISEKAKEFLSSSYDIFFIDIREPENIARAVKELGAISVLIRRVGLDPIQSNISDASVEDYNYDYIFVNETLDQFKQQAKAFVEILKEL